MGSLDRRNRLPWLTGFVWAWLNIFLGVSKSIPSLRSYFFMKNHRNTSYPTSAHHSDLLEPLYRPYSKVMLVQRKSWFFMKNSILQPLVIWLPVGVRNVSMRFWALLRWYLNTMAPIFYFRSQKYFSATKCLGAQPQIPKPGAWTRLGAQIHRNPSKIMIFHEKLDFATLSNLTSGRC